ncbi:hypothetical protein BTZ20_5357 [Rhodococcus sp. MTM3W5.2]|nr:hypothetical protein BTZ20_5357 [Rhodococcus sp. MTM3W5.2]
MVVPSSMARASGLASADAMTMSIRVRGAGASDDRRYSVGISWDRSVSGWDCSGTRISCLSRLIVESLSHDKFASW